MLVRVAIGGSEHRRPANPVRLVRSHRAYAPVLVHVVTGQGLVYALVLLHILRVAASAWYVAVRRDNLLDRMLPPQQERR